ncbi:glycosyltransferase family 4 protein [Providencia rettgeri]|nr:glycosyltransferase family 4 protein [Providencia rettgeri]EJD6673421.1 glycosyltransferase family 4 protein [Providencia rettgeri]
MYPAEENPSFGVFVANIEKELLDSNFIVDKIVIKKKKKNIFEKLYFYMFFYIKIFFSLLFKKYDFIYAHYISHCSFPILLAKIFNPHMKIISHIHGGDVKFLSGNNHAFFKLKNELSSLLLRRSEKVVCPSRTYMYYLYERYPFIKDKNTIVYPSGGVSDIFFNTKKNVSYKNTITIGYAGRLIKSKNVDKIIEGISGINNVSLYIIGDGDARESLVKQAKKINNPIEFRTSLSQFELAKFFSNIDILIYPSDSESLGLVPLEAMTAGAYAILSDIPAFREFSELGIKFKMLTTISADEIKKEVLNFIHTKSEVNSIYYNNKEIIKDNYSTQSIRDTLRNVFI